MMRGKQKSKELSLIKFEILLIFQINTNFREDVLTGEYIESDSVVAEYDKRSLELQDSNYFLMKVDAVDISLL